MSVALEDVVVTRGDFELRIGTTFADGEVTAVLGPNGAGKSTLLRAVAGLESVKEGSIAIGRQTVDDGRRRFVTPRRRSVGVVFQDYALFPHLSVLDNVTFGLRARRTPRRVARARARGVLEQLGIADLASRRPAQISGGQAQRVALARALATEPDVLLLDEPLAALDIETREAVRAELGGQLEQFAGSVVIVTHDPLDALLLADRILVVEAGRVVQDATPTDLTRRPATPYVAALVGVNLIRGYLIDGVLAAVGGGTIEVTDKVRVGRFAVAIRPESVAIHRTEPTGSPRNVWAGVVSSVQSAPDKVRVFIDAHPPVVAAITPAAVEELGIVKGTHVWVSVKATDLEVFPAP